MAGQWREITMAAVISLDERLRAARRKLRHTMRYATAKRKRAKTKAKVIAITGSSAKTTTAALLTHILSGTSKVCAQISENSLPNAVACLNRLEGDEDFVVIETGTSAPGEIGPMADLIQPDVAIVTLVAIEHYSAFRTADAIAREKSGIVTALRAGGIAILNAEDELVSAMGEQSRGRPVRIGRDRGDYKAIGCSLHPDGRLKLTIDGPQGRIDVGTTLIGLHSWLAVTAAAACALELGVAQEIVAKRISEYEQQRYRFSRHVIPGGPVFIMDNLKAPLHSIELPIETLKQISAPRKRFILGQISDYPGNPRKKYGDTYFAARAVADEVIYTGPHTHRARPSSDDISEGRFRPFPDIEALSAYLKRTAVEGDVIMVKSSRNLHLERLLLDWETGVKCWPVECGLSITCDMCGQYGRPFSEHGGARQKVRRPIWQRLFPQRIAKS